jgi:hypothetical protein
MDQCMEFPGGQESLVQVGDLSAKAIRYTRIFALVEWTDSRRHYHSEWFAAAHIKRLSSGEDRR